MSSFAVLPMLIGLFAVGDNLVLALLGEQWLICVPFLRIMCISYCFWPIHITNLQAINAVGRSDIFLKLEIVKKALSVLALVIGMQYSVTVMVGLKAFQDFLCTFVNAAPNKKLLGYPPVDGCDAVGGAVGGDGRGRVVCGQADAGSECVADAGCADWVRRGGVCRAGLVV